MRTLCIDHVTVVSPDAPRAGATFERLFALPRAVTAAPAGGAALTIGDARIEFVNPEEGTPLAEALRTGGEGMAALTLTVADLDEAARTLERAAVAFEVRSDGGRRALHVEPRAAHGVRLTLVARG
jgi:catechol 2,3-dioxygenase-like lactoylglutathione lyase family enzyme